MATTTLAYNWSSYAEGLRIRELRLSSCANCHLVRWYPTPICPACLSDAVLWIRASGEATLYSWTVVNRPFVEELKDELPIIPAIVELEEGPRFVTRLVGCEADELVVGQRMRVEFVPTEDGGYQPLFRPIG